MIILDKVDGISLPKDMGRYGNELNRLGHLGQGLHGLYLAVKQVENRYAALCDGWTFCAMGNVPGMEGAPLGFVECAFHWYSVSICNYAALVGHIGHELGVHVDKGGKNYKRRVCGAALTYRNKVGAHFARYAPSRRDNPADIAWSTMDMPNFMNGRYETGCWVFSQSSGGRTSSTKHNTNWSLTRLHEDLQHRYGPALQLQVVAPDVKETAEVGADN